MISIDSFMSISASILFALCYKKYIDIHFWYQMILLNWWEIYATIFVHQWSVSEKVVEDPQKYMYVIKGMYTQEHRLLFLLQSIVDHLSLTERITFITLSWRSYNNTALMRVYSCNIWIVKFVRIKITCL